MKILDRVNAIKKPLWINTTSGTTLGPIGLKQLTMNMEEHSFRHNLIICTKLKQPLIIGLDFAQRYRLEVDWDISGNLHIWLNGWKIATVIQNVT